MIARRKMVKVIAAATAAQWLSAAHAQTGTWPDAPEHVATLMADLAPDVVEKLTHTNAMRHFQFDPFAHRPKEACTVGALRAEATDVDTVTHAGRPADERDRDAWRTMTGGAAKVGSK